MIAELESEKATFEVNAEKAGILKTAAQEGDTLKIGDLLASIDETCKKTRVTPPAASTSNGSPVKEKKEEKKKKVAVTEELGQNTTLEDAGNKATPVASAIIADKHVDPSTISPSGTGGKILKEDVLAALANPGKITNGKSLFSREQRKEKMSLLRKTISRRLVEAKNTTAMLTTLMK